MTSLLRADRWIASWMATIADARLAIPVSESCVAWCARWVWSRSRSTIEPDRTATELSSDRPSRPGNDCWSTGSSNAHDASALALASSS